MSADLAILINAIMRSNVEQDYNFIPCFFIPF